MTAYLFPGQGSQKIGMGGDLFPEFSELIQKVDEILGYSIANLCVHDPNNQINDTAYTQPALYVVNALSYLKKRNSGQEEPDYFLGHSLGEYNALWAAGVFDFETGLRLVKKRGELMRLEVGGSMAAVIGLSSSQTASVLEKNNLENISVANFNSYRQQVLSGPKESIIQAKAYFINAGAKLYLPLAVTGAFHSSFMNAARNEFSSFLETFVFSEPKIPVIANLNALPYQKGQIHATLAQQIDHPVLWLQSIRYLLLHSESEFEEIGPGQVLTNLSSRILDGQ